MRIWKIFFFDDKKIEEMDQMKTHLHENKNSPSEKIWTYNCDIPHPLVEIICILAWLRLMSDANFTDSYQFLLRVTTILVYDSFIRVFQLDNANWSII